MRSFIRFFFILAVFIALIYGCGSDENNMKGNIDVPIEFQKYLNRFIEEGNARGYDIDFTDTGLTIKYGNLPIEASGVCAELGDGMSGSHKIEIREEYWITLSDIQKEKLIFHELGHCELSRSHDNQSFSNGDWKSIMRGYPLPAGKSAIVNYTGMRKEFYIDELFEPTTSRPSWLDISTNYDDVLIDNKTLIYEEYDMMDFDVETTLNLGNNFEIEVEFELIEGLGFGGILWSGQEINNSYHLYLNNGNELYVASGDDLFGVFHVFNYPTSIAFQPNTFTIRKQGNIYYLFLNKEFLYWIDYHGLNRGTIKSLVEPIVDIQYHSLKVYTLD